MSDPNASSAVIRQGDNTTGVKKRTNSRGARPERIPPHDLEAEKSVLGAALVSPDAAEIVAAIPAGDFYPPAHQHVAAAVAELVAGAEPVDVVTVAAQLRRGEVLELAGGTEYLVELQAVTPSLGRATAYARIVREAAARRQLIATAAEIAELGYTPNEPTEALTKASELLDRLSREANSIDRFAERVLDLNALRQLAPPSPLIAGLLDLDSLALLYGAPGIGKSFVALDMALRVATGTRWHGHQLVTAGPVLYIAAEGANGLADRIDAWKERAHHFGDPTGFAVVPSAVNLLDAAEVSGLCRHVALTQPALVIVDTLARCTPGAEENSSRDMGLAVSALDTIRTAGRSCVLAVHHAGKVLEAGLRGHSSLHGAADTVLRLTGAEHVLHLDQEKQKHHIEGNRQTYRLSATASSAAIEPYTSDPADALTGKTFAALRVLAEIEQPGGITHTRWKEAATEVAPATLSRALKTLRSTGLIALHPESTEKAPRYVLTDAGRSHVEGPASTPQEQA